MAFGTLSFTNGFKLNALQKEVSEHLHHQHNHEEVLEEVEETSDTSEEARSSKERAVAFNFEDDIKPIVVDSAPPGVNFTECVVDLQTGHCCIDFVRTVMNNKTDSSSYSRLEKSDLQLLILYWSVSQEMRRSAIHLMLQSFLQEESKNVK